MTKKTIAAITTPIGEGGISVIHISGPASIEIVNRIFRGKRLKDLSQAEDERLYYGSVMDNGVPIDEVLVNVSKKNCSFTGEDLVEINCHGGILATRKVFNRIKSTGATEVDWQELVTQSASGGKNGKIDSIQRDALLEIPKAKTALAAKVFLDQYKGALSAAIADITNRARDHGQTSLSMTPIFLKKVNSLLKTADFGIALSHPLKVTIVGSPNAGKSTIINALLGRERAIVHHEPGTTRDAVTDIISVNGIPLELTDTAGIRNTNDVIEGLAIEKTMSRLSTTNIAVVLFDNSKPLNKEDVEIIKSLEIFKGESCMETIPVVNKIDLPSALNITELQSCFSQPICRISALNGTGLPELKKRLVDRFADYIEYVPGRPIVFTERQRELLLEIGKGLSDDKGDENGVRCEAIYS